MPQVHRVIRDAIQAIEPGVTTSYSGGSSRVRSSSGREYFTKVGSLRDKEQFIGEAESLKAMDIAAPGLAPRLVASGIIGEEDAESPSDVGKPYFVCEYKELGRLTDASAKVLGKRLATELHGCKGMEGFGFNVPTFCGRTRQGNGWFATWEKCYDALIGGLLENLKEQGGYSDLCSKGEQVRAR